MISAVYSRARSWSSQYYVLLLLIGIAGVTLFSCRASSPPAPHKLTLSWVEKAHNAEKKRDYAQARRYYRNAIAQSNDPHSSAFACNELASALIFWGEYVEAIGLLRESLSYDDRQLQVWHDLGILQSRVGTAQEARTSLEQAVELGPESPRPRIALAALLVKNRQFADARAHYQVLLSLQIPQTLQQAARRAITLLNAEIESQRAPVTN